MEDKMLPGDPQDFYRGVRRSEMLILKNYSVKLAMLHSCLLIREVRLNPDGSKKDPAKGGVLCLKVNVITPQGVQTTTLHGASELEALGMYLSYLEQVGVPGEEQKRIAEQLTEEMNPDGLHLKQDPGIELVKPELPSPAEAAGPA